MANLTISISTLVLFQIPLLIFLAILQLYKVITKLKEIKGIGGKSFIPQKS